jgi:hypothetical protein
MTINTKTIFASIAAVLLIALSSPWICFLGQAQTGTAFTRTDTFPIPENNSTIRFGTNGTYTQATLKNGTWNFMNLHLSNSGNSSAVENFQVTAQDSNVTITSCQKSNGTFVSIRLRYTVAGRGVQTFKFGPDLEGGSWWVTFNGKTIAEKKGWLSMPDGTIAVTGATANVTISYYIGFGTAENSNLPFYQQHSIAMATGVAVAVTVIIAGLTKRRSGQTMQKTRLKPLKIKKVKLLTPQKTPAKLWRQNE